MAKDAFYFPHDSNARHDPKILKMRSVYKLEGFGLYWAIVEMMREQEGYFLPIDQDCIDGYAEDLHCSPEILSKFIDDCVDRFQLFKKNGHGIWSDSLLRRMKKFDNKSEEARKAAYKRWGIEAKDMPLQSDSNANAMQTQCKEIIEDNIILDNNKEGNSKNYPSQYIDFRKQVFSGLKERRITYTSKQPAAEAGAINKMLKAGHTPESILKAYDLLKAQPFWQDKNLSLMKVNVEIDEVLKGGNNQKGRLPTKYTSPEEYRARRS